jgi:hypothetical protein
MLSRSAALLALSVGLAPPVLGQAPVSRLPDERPATVGSTTPVRPNPAGVNPADPPGDAKQVVPGTAAAAPGAGCPTWCPAACECPTPCGPPGRVWANFEWLYWAASGQPLPPLVITAPLGTPPTAAGPPGSPPAIAQPPGTPIIGVLFGGQRANNDFRNGFRLSGGVWLNCDQTCGLEGEFFFLGRGRDRFAAGSDGTQAIGRPFFNALLGQPDAELVSFPGVLAGTVTVDSRSTAIGGGVNAVHNLCCDPCGRVDLLWGYRYFNLTDEVTIGEDLTSLGAGVLPAGVHFQIADRFRTSNNFHGGVIGLAAERRFSVLFVGVRASVALGGNREVTDIDGRTVITQPGGPPQAFPGGLLALPSNIGHSERTMFAVMPQVGLRAGVQLTDFARVYVGYDYLYLSNVLRAGDQIDLRVNPNLLPPAQPGAGPALPAFAHRSTDFWLQGVSAGVQVRF